MKCFNSYVSIQQDNIEINQKPIPPASLMWWYIVGASGIGLVIFFITCWCCLKYCDKKKEKKWKQAYIHERLKQIEQSSKIEMRNSVKIPRREFDELRDMAALHPDFA